MAGGKPGPAPKPTQLKLLHGENRPSHLNLAEPKPRDALPVCPDDVSDGVRAVWDDTMRELIAMDLAHAADRDSLICYCEAVVTHRRASATLAKSPLLITGQKGNLVRNPMLQIQRDAATTIRNFAAEFGLTPASRTRIEVKGGDDGAQDNPFAGTG